MWIKSASDEAHLYSFQKKWYASGHVLRCGLCLPNLLWQQTSHIQQASPASGDLNSFVLLNPQMGAAAAPIRGHASRYNSNAANRLKNPDSIYFLLFSIFTDGRLPE